MRPFSLYFHIPFCFHKCPYCDFNTYAVPSLPEKDYISALLAELDYRSTLEEWRGRSIQTIYFGGGTPSLLTPAAIRKLIATVCKLFAVNDDVEISMEANPGTVSFESLSEFREGGVNRLSLGAQSFNRETLQVLGRMHTPEQTEAAVEAAKSAGFHNINLDLMYGVPKQSVGELGADLRLALDLKPQHISAYGLTIEKGTPFFQSYKRGDLRLPEESVLLAMMAEVERTLLGNGYEHYEISNFSHPGKEARHNLAYWNGDDYLGLGAGAHSFFAHYEGERILNGVRWSNFALPSKYIQDSIARGSTESWHEELGEQSLIFESFFLGLRKIKGVSTELFEKRFGRSLQALYPHTIEILVDQELLKLVDGYLALTPKGITLADSVIENFAQPETLAPKEVLKVVGG